MISDLKNEISKKKDILEKFKQGVLLSNEKCQEVSQTLDKIINSKEKIVQERNFYNFFQKTLKLFN